jgi:hypothetical protein
LFSCSAAGETEIEVLLAVDSWGEGNLQAATVWKQLIAKEPQELPKLLEAFDRSEPLSANWIRSAAEVIIQNIVQGKTEGLFGKAELEVFLNQFLQDRNHAAVGRLFALEMLEIHFPEKLEAITDSLLADPCGEMRRPAVTKLIDAAGRASSA